MFVQIRDSLLDLDEEITFPDSRREFEELVQLAVEVVAIDGCVRRVAVMVGLGIQGVDKTPECARFSGSRLSGQAEDAPVLLEDGKPGVRLFQVKALEHGFGLEFFRKWLPLEAIISLNHEELLGEVGAVVSPWSATSEMRGVGE